MTLEEWAAKAQDLLTQLPAQTPVVIASDLTASIAVIIVNDDGQQKVVIGEV